MKYFYIYKVKDKIIKEFKTVDKLVLFATNNLDLKGSMYSNDTTTDYVHLKYLKEKK